MAQELSMNFSLLAIYESAVFWKFERHLYGTKRKKKGYWKIKAPKQMNTEKKLEKQEKFQFPGQADTEI